MGYVRIMMQTNKGTSEFIGLVICYLILVIFTVMFTFTYLKRVLYMAFLTLIAPLVALTYPIDKIGDGQAQGFNKWIKEYIFNLLIQPMHLILYYILISSVFSLAGTNVIYSIVALGFMIPAEKLLRSLFGFEKAQTPPALGGPTGTALAMGALNKLGSLWKGKNKQGALPGANGSDDNATDSPIKLADSNPYTQFGGGTAGDKNQGDSGEGKPDDKTETGKDGTAKDPTKSGDGPTGGRGTGTDGTSGTAGTDGTDTTNRRNSR
jgi:hypothetical protein